MADSDSVWLFSRHIPLGMTIAMTPGEALRVLHKPSSVVGCYEVHRTLSEDRRATDPNGDKAYRAATRKPPFVPMQRCECQHHRGRRYIPASEFADGDPICRGCRAEIQHQQHLRTLSSHGAEKQPYWKRLKLDGRTRQARALRTS